MGLGAESSGLPFTSEKEVTDADRQVICVVVGLIIALSAYDIRHNGCQQERRDLPLANVGYVVSESCSPHRATTKEAGHEEGYHICRSRCAQKLY